MLPSYYIKNYGGLNRIYGGRTFLLYEGKGGRVLSVQKGGLNGDCESFFYVRCI